MLGQRDTVARAAGALLSANIPVSLFIDPTEAVVEASHVLGVPRIELHTGDYCEARGAEQHKELQRLVRAAAVGKKLGLHVAAGHGLDYPNVGPVAAIPEIEELNIGHAIVSRAVMVGMEHAVLEMLAAVRRCSSA